MKMLSRIGLAAALVMGCVALSLPASAALDPPVFQSDHSYIDLMPATDLAPCSLTAMPADDTSMCLSPAIVASVEPKLILPILDQITFDSGRTPAVDFLGLGVDPRELIPK